MLATLAHTLVNWAIVALEWSTERLYTLDRRITRYEDRTHVNDIDEHADFANHEDPNIHS
jgi:hypothetical protein